MMAAFIVVVVVLQALLVHSEETFKDVPVKRTRSINNRWYKNWHDRYVQNLDEMVKKLKQINSSSDNAELFSLGKSTQGRPMYAMKISGKRSANKPVMYIQCLSHSNEWLTGIQCMYFADKLSSRYGSDYKVTEALDRIDIVIVPVMNVDGYVYSRKYDRNWQKNRRRVTYISKPPCYGVNLNRNFGYQWRFVKAWWDPTIEHCDNTYRGFYAFSEVETRNVANYLRGLGKNLKGFLDFHDHTRQAFQMPWKYTTNSNPDHDEQRRAAAETSKATYQVGYRQSYYSCCAAAYTGKHGGSSVDWVYGSLKVKYSYEVSMSARDGYAPNIVAEGLLAGITALAKTMQL